LLQGLAWLATRYSLRAETSLFGRDGFLAGDDAQRGAAFAAALRDPEARAVFCARGGYGATRLLPGIPWDELERAPKWVIGFSDVTALHACAARAGVRSVHAPNVTGLSRGVSASDRLALMRALEGGELGAWEGLRVLVAGEARGPIVGGNLAVLAALVGTPFLHVPRGAVLALEDVTERPYRIDRMLTSLRLAGVLERVAAIVCGEFTSCDPGPDGVTVDEVLARNLSPLGVPVVCGAPFGHGAINRAFVHGAPVRVSGGAVVLERG
jgi:muramoyltetrapeptide carboxypeptidase